MPTESVIQKVSNGCVCRRISPKVGAVDEVDTKGGKTSPQPKYEQQGVYVEGREVSLSLVYGKLKKGLRTRFSMGNDSSLLLTVNGITL